MPSAAKTASQSAHKVYARNIIFTYQNFGTVTNPAAKTKSIGLLADALLAAFFALPLIKYTLTRIFLPVNRDSHVIRLYLDEKPTSHLPGLAKNSPTLMQTATPHTTGPLAIIRCKSTHSAARTASNFIHLDKIPFRRLSICTAMRNWFFQSSATGDKFCNLDNFLRQPLKPANAHIKNWLPAMFC